MAAGGRRADRGKRSQPPPAAPSPAPRRWLLPGLIATCAAILAGGLYWSFKTGAPERDTGPGVTTATGPMFIGGADAGYVDGRLCAGCHAEIAATYRQTGMGRSFARLRPEREVEDFASSAFYHEPSRRHYRTFKRDGKYFQRRHQTGPDGREINVVEKEIHFVLGSGNHSRTYLHRTPEGKLIELPAAWYSAQGGFWAMNPGYDQPQHYGFRRAISQDCLFCHNGYPEIPPGSDAPGREPLFPGRLAEGIDCQRCHGPGKAHITAAGTGSAEAIRSSIVNPARLSKERQLETCLQCHLETTSRRLPYSIVRYDRAAFSFRPGEPLSDYILHFDHARDQGPEDKFEIAHAAYRLMKSPCFEQSGGELTCTTCHDPHQAFRGAEAVARYIAACRGCHGAPFQALVSAGRHTSESNCLDCHMPKRRTDDVVHVVMTDHLIQRRKPARDLLAPLAEVVDSEETAYRGEVVPFYPRSLAGVRDGELYAPAAQVVEGSNVAAGIPRLEAAIAKYKPQEAPFYHALAEAYLGQGDRAKAFAWYERALALQADFLPALRNYGAALARAGKAEAARQVLERGLTFYPADTGLLNNLGEAHLALGDFDAARQALERALAVDAESPEARNNLGQALARLGQTDFAGQAYQEAIRIRPDFAPAHNNLANLLDQRESFEAAERHYREAIALDPRYHTAHYNYGIALARRGRHAEAEKLLARAADLDPEHAETQNALGNLLAMRGDTPGALARFRKALALDSSLAAAHYNLGLTLAAEGQAAGAEAALRRAIALDPGYREAHFNLGQLLAALGRRDEAISHLRTAAAASDVKIREAAQAALRELNAP